MNRAPGISAAASRPASRGTRGLSVDGAPASGLNRRQHGAQIDALVEVDELASHRGAHACPLEPSPPVDEPLVAGAAGRKQREECSLPPVVLDRSSIAVRRSSFTITPPATETLISTSSETLWVVAAYIAPARPRPRRSRRRVRRSPRPNRIEVVHLLVEGGRSVERIGEAGATAIERDQARKRRQPLLVPDRSRVFPLEIQM